MEQRRKVDAEFQFAFFLSPFARFSGKLAENGGEWTGGAADDADAAATPPSAAIAPIEPG